MLTLATFILYFALLEADELQTEDEKFQPLYRHCKNVLVPFVRFSVDWTSTADALILEEHSQIYPMRVRSTG